MRIELWKGYHSPDLIDRIKQAWTKDELLILCPPALKELDFVQLLPEGEIVLTGEWGSEEAQTATASFRSKAPPTAWQKSPTQPVLGVFTTGTVSGHPRLVLYSKNNILASLASIRSVFDVSRIRTIFCYPQPFHTFGLVLGYVHAFLHELELVPLQGRYTRSFHELRSRVTSDSVLTLATPAHLHDLLGCQRQGYLSLAPSYTCILGGAPVASELWRAVRDELKIEAPSIGYGATEAAPGITHHPPGLEPIEDGEIGFALCGVEMQLIPEVGLRFAGANLCLAVIQEGKVEFPTSMVIRDDVQMRPGDGMLLYRGRIDLLLNRGGHKLSLERLEATIRSHFQIDALCAAIPHPRLGEELGVLVKGSIPEGLLSFLRSNFGASFDSRYFVSADDLPLNINAKPDRKEAARRITGAMHAT